MKTMKTMKLWTEFEEEKLLLLREDKITWTRNNDGRPEFARSLTA